MKLNQFLSQAEFFLNLKLLSTIKDIHGFYMYGKDFHSLIKRCRKHQEFVIDKKITIDNDVLTEHPKEPQTSFIDVCQRYNVAYINKSRGNIYVEYTKPILRMQEPIGVFRDNIRYLNRALSKAILDERYEKAGEIQEKIRLEENHIKKSSDASKSFARYI